MNVAEYKYRKISVVLLIISFLFDAHIPLYNFKLATLFGNLSFAMYLALYPHRLYHCPIPKHQHPLPLLLIPVIIALKHLPIGPLELAIPMHHVILPLAIIVPAIIIGELALALESILIELASVAGVVGPVELAVDFVAVVKVAGKYGAVLPVLLPLAVLRVVKP